MSLIGHTSLRDARLAKALENAPDADARPAAATRAAILQHARQATENTAAAPLPARASALPWWRRWWSGTGRPVGRPWNAAFASVLLAGVVTTLWWDREVPDARPVPAKESSATSPPAAISAAPPSPATASPSTAGAAKPLPSEAGPRSDAAEKRIERERARASQAPSTSASPSANAAGSTVASAAHPRSAEATTTQPIPASTPAPAQAMPAPAAPAAAPAPAPPPDTNVARQAPAAAPAAKAAAKDEPPQAPATATRRESRDAIGSLAAPRAFSGNTVRPEADATRWTEARVILPDDRVRTLARAQAGAMATQINTVVRGAASLQPLQEPATIRIELMRDGAELGVLELGEHAVRWTPSPPGAAQAFTGRPDAAQLRGLREALQRGP